VVGGGVLGAVLRAVLAGERIESDALLRAACEAGELAVAQWLVEHGAASMRVDCHLRFAAPHAAASGGHLPVLWCSGGRTTGRPPT
jgi:hypothetical protein